MRLSLKNKGILSLKKVFMVHMLLSLCMCGKTGEEKEKETPSQIERPSTPTVTPTSAPINESFKSYEDKIHEVKIFLRGHGICSGSFITNKHILTAGHCYLRDSNAPANDPHNHISASLSDITQVSYSLEKKDNKETYFSPEVEKVELSENYTGRKLDDPIDRDTYDIALITLKEEQKLPKGLVKDIKMKLYYDIDPSSGALISDFSQTYKFFISGFPQGRAYQKSPLEVELRSLDELHAWAGTLGTNASNMLNFAYFTKEIPSIHSQNELQSYSGGPLFVQEKTKPDHIFYLGNISQGIPLGGKSFGIQVNQMDSSMTDWLKEKLKPSYITQIKFLDGHHYILKIEKKKS